MNRATTTAGVILLVLGFAGCGTAPNETTAADPSTGTVTTDATPTPTPTPTPAPTPPPVEAGPLAIGQTATSEAGTMRLIAFRDNVKGEMYDTPSPGTRFVSIQIEQCPASGMTTYVGEWFFLDAAGGEYTSIRTMHGWPTPTFPQSIELAAPACKKGWMALELDAKAKFETVLARDVVGLNMGEWTIPPERS